jgi:hypothetical protein
MATMGFRPYPGPDARKIVHLPEGTGASFQIGDLVIFTSGKLQIATDDDDAFGIALKAYSGTADTMIPVYTITPGDRFIAEASATTAETNKGVAYALVVTTGNMAVNPGSTTTAAFYIDELDPRDGPTTGAGGRVIGRFVYTSMDAIGG